ncbi:MAG: hypothetical protein M1450_03570 [Patescibacteria group bacterium]|nr:hypothetical protein [Patescibacteria group bacterium]
MSKAGETFFTVIGCMDGRCQEAVARFGREKFNAEYPDTITEAGIVGAIAIKPTKAFLNRLKKKVMISITKHHSAGIIVDGHAECAGDPVDDESHRNHVREAVRVVREMVNAKVPVIGVFVKRTPGHPKSWEVEQLDFRFKS